VPDVPDDLIVRRAGRADFPGVLELARRALGWTDDDASFLEWKHLENPLGSSPMWVALDPSHADRVVGFRTFLRWAFTGPDGATVTAARAVDTATDPSYQGRGVFTRLTLDAIAQLPGEGVDLVFNTPNAKSLPGYLKMGWQEVGRLPVAVRPTSVRFPAVVATARTAAGRHALPSTAGDAPADVFATSATRTELDALLAGSRPATDGLATRRTPELLAWRYGLPRLGYRVVLADDARPGAGLAVFRRRPRGRAVEGVLCDVLVPEGDASTARHLVRRVAHLADADYLIRLDRHTVTRDGFVRLPRVGPMLACRPLDASPVPPLAAWALTMGDVELF
jgi:GNAT superfamily N-acetyltransferase